MTFLNTPTPDVATPVADAPERAVQPLRVLRVSNDGRLLKRDLLGHALHARGASFTLPVHARTAPPAPLLAVIQALPWRNQWRLGLDDAGGASAAQPIAKASPRQPGWPLAARAATA